MNAYCGRKEILIYNKFFYEKYVSQFFLNNIYFILCKLNKGGCCTILIFSFFMDISIELLWILKKYFKKIFLTSVDHLSNKSNTCKIICSDFLGISDDDLNKIKSVVKKMSSYNKNYTNIEINMYIKSILNIDKTLIEYTEFEKQVIKYNLIKKKYVYDSVKIYDNIINFNNDKNNEKLVNKLEENIKLKKIQIIISWLNKYKIFNQ